MTVLKHKSIYRLKKIWKSIDANQHYIYQTYDFQKTLFKRLPIYSLQEKCKYAYYEVKEQDKTVLIAPLSSKQGAYSIIGNMNGMPIYDFIYAPGFSEKDYLEAIETLLAHLNGKITFNWIAENSYIYQYAKKTNVESFHEIANVEIDILSDYDTYNASLSKNTRQNIRTAYNRLAKDEICLRFEFIQGKMDRKRLNKTMDIYNNRHSDRYGLKVSFLKKWYLKYFDFVTVFCKKSEKTCNALLYFNDEMVAFFTGLRENDKIIIPRLSIVGEYGRYSPGIILINETIKELHKQGEIQFLDLSKGEEKYKYTMGGNKYNTYSFVL